MKKIISTLLIVILFAASPAAAYSKPKIALNPANHTNPGAISDYNEAAGMIDLARKTKTEAKKHGINTKIFWDGYRTGGGISSLKREVSRANAYNPNLFVAMHSDGVPKSRGILVLYKDNAGKRVGTVIGKHIAKEMGLKFEGLSYRPNLYVLRNSKSPAILIEYLSHANLKDNKKLNDDKYRRKLAEATVEGVAIYSGVKINKPKPPEKKQPPKPAVQTVNDTNIDTDIKPKPVKESEETQEQPQSEIQPQQPKITRSTDKTSSKTTVSEKRENEKNEQKQDETKQDDGLINIIDKGLEFRPVTEGSKRISDDILKPAKTIEKTPSLFGGGLFNSGTSYLKIAFRLNS